MSPASYLTAPPRVATLQFSSGFRDSTGSGAWLQASRRALRVSPAHRSFTGGAPVLHGKGLQIAEASGVVSRSSGPGHGLAGPASAGGRRNRLLVWLTVAFALLVLLLVLVQGEDFREALSRFPAWAVIGAIGAQLLWIACRCEAWRLALNAVGPREVPRPSAHVANSLAFLVGALQSFATVPARALALRRLAPERSPTLEQTLVADAPVLALEGTLMGLLLVIAVLTTPGLPAWGAAATFAAGALALAVLVLARERLHGRGLAAGLRVLADRRRRIKLVGLTVTMSGLALSRSWFVLAGFDLPHGFASVAAFLAALGVAAALPIGLASTPAAALALFGATDSARAAAVGVAMAATSLAAVITYGLLSLTATTLVARRAARRDAALRHASGGTEEAAQAEAA
jgi:hypothetical protein